MNNPKKNNIDNIVNDNLNFNIDQSENKPIAEMFDQFETPEIDAIDKMNNKQMIDEFMNILQECDVKDLKPIIDAIGGD